ncbi:MAG: ParB family protein [Micromonosporaceae bacterium]
MSVGSASPVGDAQDGVRPSDGLGGDNVLDGGVLDGGALGGDGLRGVDALRDGDALRGDGAIGGLAGGMSEGMADAVAGAAAPTAPSMAAGDGIDPAERTPRSFHLSRQLLERARAAAHWAGRLPELQEPTNVSELVERALRGEVERLERRYNAGVPFPAVQGKLRTGPGASGVERIRRAQRERRRPT